MSINLIIIIYFLLFLIQCSNYGISESNNFENKNYEIIGSIPYNNNIMIFSKSATFIIDENNKHKSNSFNISLEKVISTNYLISDSKLFYVCTNSNAIMVYDLNNGNKIQSLSYVNLNLTKTEHKCNVKINKEKDTLILSYSNVIYNSTENMHYLIKEFVKIDFKNNKLGELNFFFFEKEIISKEISESYISCDFDYNNKILCIYYSLTKNALLLSYISNNKIINENQLFIIGQINQFYLLNIDFNSFFICAYDSNSSIITYEKILIDKVKDEKYEIQKNQALVLSSSVNNINFIQFENNYLYITYDEELSEKRIITIKEIQYETQNDYIDEIQEINVEAKSVNISFIQSNIFPNKNNLLHIIYSYDNNRIQSFIITFPKKLQCKNSNFYLHSNEKLTLNLNEIILNYKEEKNEEVKIFFNSSNGFTGIPSINESKFIYQSDNYGKEILHIGIEYNNKNQILISNKCIINIQVCNQACELCDEFSIEKYNTKCIKCNNKEKYFQTFNNNTLCFNSEEKIKKYYFNHITNTFMNCYLTCNTCSWGGTERNQLCTSCEDKYIFDKNKHNCILKDNYTCLGLFYMENNNKFCLDNNNCPIDYPYLIENKKECVNKCPKNLITFSNICYEKCPTNLKNVIYDDKGCHCQHYWIQYADKSIKCLNLNENCPNEYKFNNTLTKECLIIGDDNNKNKNCNNLWYINDENEKKCVNICPKDFNFIVFESKECVKKCSGDSPFIYNKYCYKKCPDETTNENFECKDIINKTFERIIKDIENLFKSQNKPNEEFEYLYNDYKFNVKNFNKDDFNENKDCFINIEPYYYMIIETYFIGSYVNSIQYIFYDKNFDKIQLSCNELYKNYIFSLHKSQNNNRYEKYIVKYNVDLYDIKGRYYNDLCLLDFEDDPKVNLNLKLRNYLYEDILICGENCIYKGYNYIKKNSTIELKCYCNVIPPLKGYGYNISTEKKNYKNKNSLLVFKCIYHLFNSRNYTNLDERYIFHFCFILTLLFSIPSILKKEKLGIPIPSTNETNITKNNDNTSEKVVEISSSVSAKQIKESKKERKAEIIIPFSEQNIFKRYCKIFIKFHPCLFFIFDFSFLNLSLFFNCGLITMSFVILIENNIFNSVFSVIIYLMLRFVQNEKKLSIINCIIGLLTWSYITLYFLIFTYLYLKIRIWYYSLIYVLILPVFYSILLIFLPQKFLNIK